MMKSRCVIILFWLCLTLPGFAQNAAFDSFISRISNQYKVDVAIAPELIPTLDSLRQVGTEITSIEELLRRLLNHSGITYQIIDGNKLMLRREDPSDENPMIAVLQGIVTDHQHGNPLAYATVMTLNGNAGCNTDENGRFILPVPDTTGDLQISFLGFKTVTMPIRMFLSGNPQINMEIDKIPLHEVVVIVPYRLMSQNPTAQSTDLSGYQFISEDQLLSWNAERLITSLTTYTHYSSDQGIRIRGTQAGNSLVVMDDIPVYDPYHFYNIFSPFNGQYFSSVEVYKNNLPIEYGGRIDGMIHIQSDREKPSSKLIFDTDLLLTSLTTELVISPEVCLTAGARVSHTAMLKEALSDSAAANFSLPGRFKDENEWSTTQQPTSDFYDINLGLGIQPGKSDRISLNFFNSSDQLDYVTHTDFQTSIMNHEVVNVQQSYESTDQWKNLGISAGYERNIDKKTTVHLQSFYSIFDKDVDYRSQLDEVRHGELKTNINTGQQQSKLTTSGLKSYMHHHTAGQAGYTVGLEWQADQVDFAARENNKRYLTQNQTEDEISLFGEYNSTVWKDLQWTLGSRLTYLQSTSQLYPLPNVRLQYLIDEHYGVRAAFSKNLQAVHELTLENRFGRELDYLVLSEPEQGYPVLKSDKYMIGGGYTATCLSLDAEVYYKKMNGLATVRPLHPDPSFGGGNNNEPDEFYQLFTGDGWTAGVDLTVLYKRKRTEASLLYTLSKISERYDMLYNGDYISPQEDRRHQLKAAGSYTLGDFQFSTLLTYKSKAPYLSFVRLEGGDGVGSINQQAVQRYLPPYFSLDLGVDYSFKCFKQPAMVGVSLINATNHENINDLQHLGKISREGGRELFITSQTELLGRTANVHFRYLIN